MRRSTILPFLLATALVGCGSASGDDSGESGAQEQAGAGSAQVSAADVADVIVARQTITEACNGERPRSDLIPVVQQVTALVREGPSDRFESGQTDTPQTMSSVAQDLARVLDQCQAGALAGQLRKVATGLTPAQKGSPGY